MKNTALIFLPLLIISVSACHDEPRKLELLESDAIALAHISERFETEAEGYPHPWSPTDPSTWNGTLRLDTVVDPESEQPFLTVGAITLYIYKTRACPMDIWLSRLENVKDFKLFAVPGSVVLPQYIPWSCDSVLVDKIDQNVEGYIEVPDMNWDTNNRNYSKLSLHWLNMKNVNFVFTFQAIVDLSNNKLTDAVSHTFGRFTNKVNLSHNNFTRLAGTWEYWFKGENVPNLQYNDIPIPEEIIGTNFWKENHQWFIGNPGYVAPE